ncbi:MAG: hypothetical protein HY819_15170 [Acidobacteria bacterium]|nr:hypothetical protein [Acidobacteriota bacterium]
MFTFKIRFRGLVALAKDISGGEGKEKLYAVLLNGTNPGQSSRNRRFFTHIPSLSFNVADLSKGDLGKLEYVTLDNNNNPLKAYVMLNKEKIDLIYKTDEDALTFNAMDKIPSMDDIYPETGVNLKPTLYANAFPEDDALARMVIEKGAIEQDDETNDYFMFEDPNGNSYGNEIKFARDVVLTTKVKRGTVKLKLTRYQEGRKAGEETYSFRPIAENGTVEVTIQNMPPSYVAPPNFNVQEGTLTVFDEWKEDHDFELLYSATEDGLPNKRVPKKSRLGPPTLGGTGTYPPIVCGIALFKDIS